MSTLAIRQLCVNSARFHPSNRRAKIMDNLETLIDGLRMIGVSGKVWVDGSFLTEKIDPNDVDIVLELDEATWKGLSPQQRADIQWLEKNGEIKTDYDCDSHLFVSYPVGHKNHDLGEWHRGFYINLFGWVGFYDVKGIAIVVL